MKEIIPNILSSNFKKNVERLLQDEKQIPSNCTLNSKNPFIYIENETSTFFAYYDCLMETSQNQVEYLGTEESVIAILRNENDNKIINDNLKFKENFDTIYNERKNNINNKLYTIVHLIFTNGMKEKNIYIFNVGFSCNKENNCDKITNITLNEGEISCKKRKYGKFMCDFEKNETQNSRDDNKTIYINVVNEKEKMIIIYNQENEPQNILNYMNFFEGKENLESNLYIPLSDKEISGLKTDTINSIGI